MESFHVHKRTNIVATGHVYCAQSLRLVYTKSIPKRLCGGSTSQTELQEFTGSVSPADPYVARFGPLASGEEWSKRETCFDKWSLSWEAGWRHACCFAVKRGRWMPNADCRTMTTRHQSFSFFRSSSFISFSYYCYWWSLIAVCGVLLTQCCRGTVLAAAAADDDDDRFVKGKIMMVISIHCGTFDRIRNR